MHVAPGMRDTVNNQPLKLSLKRDKGLPFQAPSSSITASKNPLEMTAELGAGNRET